MRRGAVTIIILVISATGTARAATLPAGFSETAVLTGLADPTSARFAPGGDPRIFVAEKSGLVKVFDGPGDTSAQVAADLRTNVYNYWDRGMMALEVDPSFPARPYVYVLYSHDAAIGGTAPRWGTAGATYDDCPSPPGPTDSGCVTSGRLSRLQLDPATNTLVDERILVEDWCGQFPSHTVAGLGFGPDGKLYASGGDGASWEFADYGQRGTPLNPCGDPPGGVGGVQVPPTAQGGMLRSQDIRTAGDPVALNGSLIRVDPDTGFAPSDNPLVSHADVNARRIVAYGMRNPFRFTFRPGTSELWVGDVGWSRWEEVDRLLSPTDAIVENLGWPCYEGTGRLAAIDNADLDLCESLYAAGPGAMHAPYWQYPHEVRVAPGDGCTLERGVSPTGIAFYAGGGYPEPYEDGMFLADFPQRCILFMPSGADGLPDPARVAEFAAGFDPVDLQIGPGGDLYYVDITAGTITRIQYPGGNRPPVARAKANPAEGPVPLAVSFDAASSSDPDPGDALTFAWDLDEDGEYDDSAQASPTRSYSTPGAITARLRVTDGSGATDVSDPIVVRPGATRPEARIDVPVAGSSWRANQTVEFSGGATDAQDGALPPAALTWSVILKHCPAACHSHPLQSFEGVEDGEFTAPDHEYPTHLELRLTATDSTGLTDTRSVRLDPRTLRLRVESDPPARELGLNHAVGRAPLTDTVIAGSANSVSVSTPQSDGTNTFHFRGWSDGRAAAHDVTAGDEHATLLATFDQIPRNVTAPVIAGEPREGEVLTGAAGGWSGTEPISHAWEWMRCDAGGSGCTPVANAGTSAYRLTGEDVGRRLRLQVTADNRAPGATAALSQPTEAVDARRVAAASDPPPTVLQPAPLVQLADRTPPRTVLLGFQRQRPLFTGYVWVDVACPLETCAVTGRVTLSTTPSRTMPLGVLSARVPAVTKRRLRFRLSLAARRFARTAIARRRPLRAALVVTARDAANNPVTRTRIIRLAP